MTLISQIIRLAGTNRLRHIDHFRRHAPSVQSSQIDHLLESACRCDYLRSRGVTTASDFKKRVPIVSYEELAPEIERVMAGEQNVLWSTPIRWAAKSSGTTNDKSKYIPISVESLNDCHFRASKDIIINFCDNFPNSKALTGKALTLGGSHRISNEAAGIMCGDLSAILIENTPSWFAHRRIPSLQAALTADFEQKVEKICRETVGKNVTSFAGVPSWNLVLMNKLLDYTGKNNILEIWKDMSLFIHGGISFSPYREQYERLFPGEQMKYMETYNASEGFFAMQDDPSDSAMLLMLDLGIYYEFLPMNMLHDHSGVVPLEGVKKGVNYAMIISTNGGLWRYMIGDTVEFTSISPYKIKITGRTKQFINAFGEELIVDNAECALHAACRQTHAVMRDYTAAPVFMEGRQKGRHQWVIEFEKEPDCVNRFTEILDKTIQNVNSDYEAKRFRNTTLEEPIVTVVGSGTFYRWLSSKGKVGGQNKVPRLSGDRKIVEQLLTHT